MEQINVLTNFLLKHDMYIAHVRTQIWLQITVGQMY